MLFRDPVLQRLFEREIVRTVDRHQRQFGWSAGDVSAPPELSYIVCATPRSGSSLLCEALRLTGVAGVPQEYFLYGLGEIATPDGRVAAADGVSFPEYLRAMIHLGTGPNHVFGFKVMWSYFDSFIGRLSSIASAVEPSIVLGEVFSNLRYVHVSRRDKVRQAVSLAKAVQTSRWKSYHPAAHGIELSYDAEQIAGFHSMLLQQEREWESFFQRSGVRPRRVLYEQMVESFRESAMDTVRFLGLPDPEAPQFEARELASMTDETNDQWTARFMAEASRVESEGQKAGGWALETHDGSEANVERLDDSTRRITISRLTGPLAWLVKVNITNVQLHAGRQYILRFRAKADDTRPLSFGVGEDAPPWSDLGLYASVRLTAEWNAYERTFVATASVPRARVFFDLGEDSRPVELAHVELRPIDSGP